MARLKVISFNAHGLRDNNKRKQLFKLLREKKADIIFIQEAHCTPDVVNLWRNEWDGNLFHSAGESNV